MRLVLRKAHRFRTVFIALASSHRILLLHGDFMMRANLFAVILGCSLPWFGMAAKAKTVDKFEQYHAKFTSGPSPLKLDDASYERLTAAPRDYSVAVLLTALEARFGCKLCRDFQPEWDVVGRSWIRGNKRGDTRLLLGTLDFADGKGTFQKVCWHPGARTD